MRLKQLKRFRFHRRLNERVSRSNERTKRRASPEAVERSANNVRVFPAARRSPSPKFRWSTFSLQRPKTKWETKIQLERTRLLMIVVDRFARRRLRLPLQSQFMTNLKSLADGSNNAHRVILNRIERKFSSSAHRHSIRTRPVSSDRGSLRRDLPFCSPWTHYNGSNCSHCHGRWNWRFSNLGYRVKRKTLWKNNRRVACFAHRSSSCLTDRSDVEE